MRFFNLAKIFKEQPTCEDILKKVRNTEILYWICFLVSLFIAMGGGNIILNAPENDLKEHAWGLFLAILGIVNIAVIKLWAHIKLTMYYIIWDRNNRIEAEINKLEAQDL